MEFIATWDQEGGLEQMAECDDIAEDVLAANPDIKTFKKVWPHVLTRKYIVD